MFSDEIQVELGNFRIQDTYSTKVYNGELYIKEWTPSSLDRSSYESIYVDLGNLRTQDAFTAVAEAKGKGKSRKLLPTKAVSVGGKNPHIRTKQHYKPEDGAAPIKSKKSEDIISSSPKKSESTPDTTVKKGDKKISRREKKRLEVKEDFSKTIDDAVGIMSGSDKEIREYSEIIK